MDFNPPKAVPKIKVPEWATYVPDRTTKGKFAIHNTRAHALNALKGREGIMYHAENGEWVEVTRVEAKDLVTCHGCGKDLSNRYGWSPYSTKWLHEPALKCVGICYDCR